MLKASRPGCFFNDLTYSKDYDFEEVNMDRMPRIYGIYAGIAFYSNFLCKFAQRTATSTEVGDYAGIG